MLTDIPHAFAQNPIPPAYDRRGAFPARREPATKRFRAGDEWVMLNEGIHTVGQRRRTRSTSTTRNPRHRTLVGPVGWRATSFTNAEWLAFMKDGGYSTPTLWLMDGFATVSNEQWQAPGHWRELDGQWQVMTLAD